MTEQLFAQVGASIVTAALILLLVVSVLVGLIVLFRGRKRFNATFAGLGLSVSLSSDTKSDAGELNKLDPQ